VTNTLHAYPWRFGPQRLADGRTRFRLWAPDAAGEIALEVEGLAPVVMQAPSAGPDDDSSHGWLQAELDCAAGARYRFKLADGQRVPDPASRAQAHDIHDASIVTDPDAYVWRHPDWPGRPWHQAVVYELHVGLLGGFRAVADKLPELAALGVTALELMPVADFPGPRNWGYDGVLPYAPDASYGTPDDLKALVDAAHELGLMVLLDVVYNHFGPDGNYLGLYARSFFRDDLNTPWGGAIDFRRAEVRAFFTENALYWLTEFRFDGLRFDAVHAIRDADWLDETAFVIRALLGAERHVHLVLENEANAARHLGQPFNAQWNDDAHHALHVLLTGERDGYYADYADAPAAKLARALAEGFIYQGEVSPHLSALAGATVARGEPSAHLPPSAFVLSLQNHDQIGNRAFGERLTTLAHPAALRAAIALQLLCPQIPLLFMGEEIGSPTPFLFFTSHSDALAEAVRVGRRREFARFPAFAEAASRERIPDPNRGETFAASLPRAAAYTGEFNPWTVLYQSLLMLRRQVLFPHLASVTALGAQAVGPAAVVARWRIGHPGHGAVLALFANLAEAAVTLEAALRPRPGQLLFETCGDAAQPYAPEHSARLPGYTTVAWLETEVENVDTNRGCNEGEPQQTAPGVSEAALFALAEAAGIITHWDDAQGQAQVLKPEVLQRVLTAMAIDCGTSAQIQASQARLDAEAAAPEAAPLLTAELDEPIRLHWAQAVAAQPFEIQLEDGTRLEGIAQRDDSTGELRLPGIAVYGYHVLRMGTLQCVLAVAPAQCYGVADALRAAARDPGSRLWGVAVQIYALRHGAPSGSGNFSSLAQCCQAAARAGADAVAINPVHAGFSADPARYSPYSPSSRLFLNPLYIDPARVFGPVAAHEAAASLGLLERMQQLDSLAEIDWPELGRARLAILRHLFERRRALLSPAQLEAYQQFCMSGGDALRSHACFEALHRFHALEGNGAHERVSDWRNWPQAHRDPLAPALAAFAHEHAEEIEFHQFLQWLAADGLDGAQRGAREGGMALGLIADLAVGTDASGSHAWSRQDEIFEGLQVGAPPDLLNAQGQSWGISAFSPRGLRRHGYRAFIEMLRAVLAQAGGLRIDHALGLARLWLIPAGGGPADGAYLRFPCDDLMRLIALESWRARAIIIGENLGTVPPGFNQQLSRRGLLGIGVLWFERASAGDGREPFRPPGAWSSAAIATTATHDLPSVAGWWSGRDLEWREQLSLFAAGHSSADAGRQREADRQTLWQALVEAGVASGDCPGPQSLAPVEAALKFVGSTPAPLVIVPLEDLLGLREQPNVPGTTAGHPNWQRRLPYDIRSVFGRREVAQRIAALNAARRAKQ
jgi:malto-oligosyltrehalose trehalohydrolase/4-alpha-glucanotransferase